MNIVLDKIAIGIMVVLILAFLGFALFFAFQNPGFAGLLTLIALVVWAMKRIDNRNLL